MHTLVLTSGWPSARSSRVDSLLLELGWCISQGGGRKCQRVSASKTSGWH